MKALALAVVPLWAGCGGEDVLVARTAASVHVAADHPYRGTQLDALFGFNGVELGAAAYEQQVVRAHDPNSHASGGVAVLARYSLIDSLLRRPGLSANFDAGFDAGAGAGFGDADGYDILSQTWYGGWVDLGIVGSDERTSYVLALGVRDVAHSGVWTNGVVYTIGVALAYHGNSH